MTGVGEVESDKAIASIQLFSPSADAEFQS